MTLISLDAIVQLLIGVVPAIVLLLIVKLTFIQELQSYRCTHLPKLSDVLNESINLKLIVTSVFLIFQSIVLSILAPSTYIYLFLVAMMTLNVAALSCLIVDYEYARKLCAFLRESKNIPRQKTVETEFDNFVSVGATDIGYLMQPVSQDINVTGGETKTLSDIGRETKVLSGIKLLCLFILIAFPVLFLSMIVQDQEGIWLSYYLELKMSGVVSPHATALDKVAAGVISLFNFTPSCSAAKCGALDIITQLMNSSSMKFASFIYFFCLTYPIINYLANLKTFNSLMSDKVNSDLGLELDVAQTLSTAVTIFFSLLISLIFIDVPLGEIGIFSGIVAAGLSIAMKDTLGNLMAGALLIADGSLKKGDVITIPRTDSNDTGSTYGIIQKMKMRYTVVEDRNTVRRLIPNSILVSSPIESWTHEDSKVRLSLKIGVAYDTDLAKAKQLMESVCYDVSRVLSEKPPQAMVTDFGESSIVLSLRFWLKDTSQGIRPVISEVLINLKQRFDEEGIEIPFPQRDFNLKVIDDC